MRLRETESLGLPWRAYLLQDRTTQDSPPTTQHLAHLWSPRQPRHRWSVPALPYRCTHHLHIANFHRSRESRWTGMRACTLVIIALLDEMSHHMTLQMVYINHRNIERTGKSLGKATPTRSQPIRPGHGWRLRQKDSFLLDAGARDGLVNNQNHILLVGAGNQLRNDTAVSLVNLLRGGTLLAAHHSRALRQRYRRSCSIPNIYISSFLNI